ncbi:MAG TPA: NUDIX domain-containing protein, partial [Patescibacteria group bacterium]|nr:NUDIX domain-containing protein [Patescibacteria group bacterium]
MGKDTQETTVLTKSSSAVVREFSSGGVVYKNEGEKVLWLIGKSTPSKRFPETYWRLPKGWMDDRDGGDNPGPISSGEVKATDNDLKTGALREVKEEVGVEAKIIS